MLMLWDRLQQRNKALVCIVIADKGLTARILLPADVDTARYACPAVEG